jgi:ABC-type dipeptide/oligopeptide/nickel transport system permease subunit
MSSVTGVPTSAWRRLIHASAQDKRAVIQTGHRRRRRFGAPGIVALTGLLTIILAVLIGPWLWTHDPLAQQIANRLAPPSATHPFGTDQFGRDMLARVLAGGRWSLLGAGIVCAGTSVLGFLLGALAAAGPRWLDQLISRLTETFQAVPNILLALAITALLSPSFGNLLLALVLTNWTWYARMYRALIIKELAASYVEGAHALGLHPARVLLRHVLPNILGPVVVVTTINVGAVILNLSALSFIGFGVQPPTPEWGSLINEGRMFFQRLPLLMMIPGMCIAATVLCINVLGNALRDWVDVQ